ncbi:hypothetical protein SD77_0041 [Bacillus badius]|uniref:Mobile element protein n=1 Tax=Bacillus badius TaxID=1455 RepID=A0ABR5B110_BACBA|nr:hypothetical protein SD77_0041 [Bacillus badius]
MCGQPAAEIMGKKRALEVRFFSVLQAAGLQRMEKTRYT